jgi:hypothetical protein
MKNLSLLVLAIVFSMSTMAQISITSADLMDVGDSVTLAVVDEVPPGFFPGPAGANQHWIFSDLEMDTTSQLEFVNPANTPYGASFPTSNIAVEGLADFLIEGAWAYATKNTFVFQVDGLAGSYDIFEDIVVPLNPSEVMYSFPINYLDNSSQTSIADISLPSPEPLADSIRLKVVTTVEMEVDAWGELTTPTWTGQVLRIRDVRTTVDSVWVKLLFFWAYLESSTTVGITYKYMANDQGYPVMQFMADSSNTQFSGLNYLLDPDVGLADHDGLEGFNYNVYPNPAGPVLNIRWNDIRSGNFSLSDIYGRQLRSQDFANTSEIKLLTSDLARGIYVYQLRLDGVSEIYSGKVVVGP